MGNKGECVGCGYCCIKAPCTASARLYPGAISCPQLIWDEDKSRYFCGLMMLPGDLGKFYRRELYAGTGCCSSLNSWRKDVKKREFPKPSFGNPLTPEFQIFLRCYASGFVGSDEVQLLLIQFISELKKRSYSEGAIHHLVVNIENIISQNRSSSFKEFMG